MKKRNHYLIVGSGKVAKHFAKYLRLAGAQWTSWSRSENKTQELAERLKTATHVLLAISDSAIPGWLENELKGFTGVIIHFSGAHDYPGTTGLHPLMTFGPELYNLETYEKIHFVTTQDLQDSDRILEFKNPIHRIFSVEKAKYHALCVMASNFTNLLWRKLYSDFGRMGLPEAATEVFLEQTFKNIKSNPQSSLTGPLLRKDTTTISKNLKALSEDPHQLIYQAFVEAYFPEYFETKIQPGVTSENS